MKQGLQSVLLLCCFLLNHVYSSKLPGPLVYVVTPSTKTQQVDKGRAAPFYYNNWMKRMDTPNGFTSTTTEKVKTPDLIFAEFESNSKDMKSIRKLLEKEKLELKSTTTSTPLPIYVPDEEPDASESSYGIPQSSTEKANKVDMTDYFALYNNLYNTGPVYVPSAPSSSEPSSTTSTIGTTTTTTTPSTTEAALNNVENIWHIIDSEKHEQYSSKWNEVPISPEQTNSDAVNGIDRPDDENKPDDKPIEHDDIIDENFALPGFGTNPGNDGENESRAIRTESNIRFPYVNLKPFMMKNLNTKKMNNMFNLDSFTDIKNPVRGEVQDNSMVPIRQPIDRYNPAQPYLPEYGIGVKSKPSAKPSAPVAPATPPRPPPTRTVANLVPPPPPSPPKLTADDFPNPSTYESFPPYASSDPGMNPNFSFPPSVIGADSSSGDDDGTMSAPPTDIGYKYKPPSNSPPAAVTPSAPSAPFAPTLPPMMKPFSGYSYNKPQFTQDVMKPFPGYSYDKPQMTQDDNPPTMDVEEKPDFQGYHYSPPAPALQPPTDDHPPLSYGHHDALPHSYQPETDYPDLIFDKPHKAMGDMKGGDDMKANDAGMMPPPPPANDDKPAMDDHGFPHDFPGDFKYAHDFDDHDYHHHHHHTTTTTTTTEMPRVNRYSYYYLGKKLYYLPLYFSVYFVVYVGALIIKAVLRHKITYPNSYRPNSQTATFFSKRSIEPHLSNENLHEITGRVTKAIAEAAEKYINDKSKNE